MPEKVYEWFLYNKNSLVRQGILCSASKKDAEHYLLRSLNDNEKELFSNYKLTIKLLDIK